MDVRINFLRCVSIKLHFYVLTEVINYWPYLLIIDVAGGMANGGRTDTQPSIHRMLNSDQHVQMSYFIEIINLVAPTPKLRCDRDFTSATLQPMPLGL